MAHFPQLVPQFARPRRLALLAVLAAAALPSTADARAGGYDGIWNVTFATTRGNCSSGYSVPFTVTGGRVSSAGGGRVSGRVKRSGTVAVNVSVGASHEALVDPLGDERVRDLLEELLVEPGHQPAHLDALAKRLRHQALGSHPGAVGLVDIFGDDRRAWDRRLLVVHQNRRRAGRIEQQKCLAPFPAALFDQLQVEPVFARDQADESRMRTERMMKQRKHGPYLSGH